VLNALAGNVPWLVGGSADLSPSTKTDLKNFGSFQADNPGGRTIHFGVREHAMGAIANGMALSYLKPFTATFLVFADYMRAPVRLAAIMELPVTFVFTHDRSGSARTARPTSRSSIWQHCARCPGSTPSAREMRTRRPRRGNLPSARPVGRAR
jgi:transketolase C-terminal domain/subunit